jgi:hypothetical protein
MLIATATTPEISTLGNPPLDTYSMWETALFHGNQLDNMLSPF